MTQACGFAGDMVTFCNSKDRLGGGSDDPSGETGMPLRLVPERRASPAPSVTTCAKRGQTLRLLQERSFHTVYQPIRDLRSNGIVGFECLTGFAHTPHRSPDRWFEDAADVGLGVPLELQTFKAALGACAALPSAAFIALNVSPVTVASGWISALLKAVDPRRVVLELAEHAPVADDGTLPAVLRHLRERGVRIAIDDVGAGYANLQDILTLRPDIMKLDVTLTKDVDIRPSRAAGLSGLVQFAQLSAARCSRKA